MEQSENNIVLASAWYPRGELVRLQRLYPSISQAYSRIVITLPPYVDPPIIHGLRHVDRNLDIVITQDWSWGRYLALSKAVELNADFIHYVDFDRLLRWVETRPEEWREVVVSLQKADCMILGRTSAAYATHPLALVQTESISNFVVSEQLGRPMDVSAGSNGFSRNAAKYLLAHCQPGRALGTDGEWPVVLNRGGFTIDYLEVDGLDWEIADNYQLIAADRDNQQRMAQEYDEDPRHWTQRVQIAYEIVQSCLEAARRAI